MQCLLWIICRSHPLCQPFNALSRELHNKVIHIKHQSLREDHSLLLLGQSLPFGIIRNAFNALLHRPASTSGHKVTFQGLEALIIRLCNQWLPKNLPFWEQTWTPTAPKGKHFPRQRKSRRTVSKGTDLHNRWKKNSLLQSGSNSALL